MYNPRGLWFQECPHTGALLIHVGNVFYASATLYDDGHWIYTPTVEARDVEHQKVLDRFRSKMGLREDEVTVRWSDDLR